MGVIPVGIPVRFTPFFLLVIVKGMEAQARSPWILIVDDDDDIRETMRFALELEGYDVRMASNGLEAKEMASKGVAPGLIFLDLMMPKMDGREFLAATRAEGLFLGVPVVVLTAASGQVKPEGAIDLVHKPLDLEVLLGAAQKYLGAA